jgi:hypothetical protein
MGKIWVGPRALAPPPEDMCGAINAKIDAALVSIKETDKPRGYLGGSRIGLECLRQLGYEYHSGKAASEAYDRDPEGYRRKHNFDGGILRIFALGHVVENEVARLMRLAGFHLRTHRENGSQFGWATATDPETGKSRMRGHADGIIDDAPFALPFPLLWECKSMKATKWKETVSRGVLAVYPVYFGQIQTYMAYLDLKNALFTSYNKDTSELYFELVPFDQQCAQNLTDRGVYVLQTKSPKELPRVTEDQTNFRCKFCDYAKDCWDSPKPKRATPTPAWLKAQT